MREVKVFKMESQEIFGVSRSVKVFDAIALFHQFAQEADGEGHSTPVAIVERADGQVETVYTHLIAFAAPASAESAPLWVAAAKAARQQLREWMNSHGQDIASQEAIKQINTSLKAAGLE